MSALTPPLTPPVKKADPSVAQSRHPVAHALSVRGLRVGFPAIARDDIGRTQSDRTTGHVAPDTSLKTLPLAALSRPDTPDTSPSGTPDATDRNAAGVRFLAFLEERGGVLVSGQREIGRTMGWSKS